MRLEPIDKPKNLKLKMEYHMIGREFGKVLTPFKVIYARKPELISISQRIEKMANRKLSMDASFRLLIQVFCSMANGCSYCHDFRQTQALKKHLESEKFQDLEYYQTSELFSRREHAALSYVEQSLKYKNVTEDTFNTLKKYFTEIEIVELTWLIAAENYYNTLMIPLGIESDSLCMLAEESMKH